MVQWFHAQLSKMYIQCHLSNEAVSPMEKKYVKLKSQHKGAVIDVEIFQCGNTLAKTRILMINKAKKIVGKVCKL